ncbi:hypothetical protein CR513_26446, partial [Mucuna pruriens]
MDIAFVVQQLSQYISQSQKITIRLSFLILWKSKKQFTVSRSNSKVEYHTLTTHNFTFHKRTKHIEIDYHVICKNIQIRLIHLLPLPSLDQIVDMFTKSLLS